MGWRFLRSDETAEADDWRDVDVRIIDRPADTTPGSPLPCRNDGDPVRVGERVHLVVGKIAVGTSIEPGTRVLCSEAPGEDPTYVKVQSVEPAGAGEIGLVLAGVSADRFQLGDEVVHVELP